MIGVLIKEDNSWFISTKEKKYNINIYHQSTAALLNSYLPSGSEVEFDLIFGEKEGAFIKNKII